MKNKNNLKNLPIKITVQQLLQQKTKSILMKIPWIRLGIFLSFIMLWVYIPVIWFVWLFWLVLWSFVLASHIKKRMKNAEYKKRIQSFTYEETLRIEVKKKYPILSSEQVDLLILGYKDFLHISLMSPIFTKMPSKALDDLWTVLIEKTDFRSFEYTLGFHLTRRSNAKVEYEHEGYQQMDDKRQFMERNITWKIACQLEGLNPLNTNRLPRIYLIDQVLAWEFSYQHDLESLKEEYALYKKHYNNYEDLHYFIVREIPHLGIKANFPPDDST